MAMAKESFYGDTSVDPRDDTFQSFPTYEDGRSAQRDLWRTSPYQTRTVREAIKRWSPDASHAHISEMLDAANASNSEKLMSAVTADELEEIMDVQQRWEGWRPPAPGRQASRSFRNNNPGNIKITNSMMQAPSDSSSPASPPSSTATSNADDHPNETQMIYQGKNSRVKSGTRVWVKNENVEKALLSNFVHVDTPGVDINTATTNTQDPDRSLSQSLIPTALRIAPAIAGSAVGALRGKIGMSALGGLGAGAGEYMAQAWETPGDQDINWNQVVAQSGLQALPIPKWGASTMAKIPGMRQVGERLANTALGRAFAKSATASTPMQRVMQQLPRTIAKSSVEGSVLGGASGTPTRTAAGQPTTMGDIVRDVGYGAAVGGAMPLVPRGLVEAARNPTLNTLASGAVAAGAGYAARSGGPDSMAVGAYGGWKLAQSALNKIMKWGLPDAPSGGSALKNPNGKIPKPDAVLKDVTEAADIFASIDELSIDMHASKGKQFSDGVEFARKNRMIIPPSVERQLDRIKDMMLTPKANAALRRMSSDEFLDENGLIDIERFTDGEALKYHNTLAEAIDSASRAGRPITENEKWRQAFEGLRERVQADRSRDYASAIDSLVDPSILNKEAFESALKALPTKMQGEILQNDLALINILRRNFDLSGGTLVQGQGADNQGLVGILRSMSSPIMQSTDPTPPRGGAPGDPVYTVPTGVRTLVAPDRQSAISVDVDRNSMGGRLVDGTPGLTEAERQASQTRVLGNIIGEAQDDIPIPTPSSGGPFIPTQNVRTVVSPDGQSATTLEVDPKNMGGSLVNGRERLNIKTTLEEAMAPDPSAQVHNKVLSIAAGEGPPGSGSAVPSEVNYDQYRTGSGAATPEVGPAMGARTPIAPGKAVVRDAAEDAVSTVESRAQARGVTPEVASAKPLTPVRIRELLSDRPGLDAAILAQKLVGKPKLYNPQNKLNTDYERFSQLYKELSGSPPTEGKHYSPSHVLGLYYASGTNKTKAERSLIKRIITAVLKQPGMGSQESIDRLLGTMEKAG